MGVYKKLTIIHLYLEFFKKTHDFLHGHHFKKMPDNMYTYNNLLIVVEKGVGINSIVAPCIFVLYELADMRASRAVLSSSVWEIHGSVGEILAAGRYWVRGGIEIIDSQTITLYIEPFFHSKLISRPF